eukprot:gene5699-10948_t
MPRVALSLIQEKTGKIYVKYSGPPEFREFGHDPGIIKEFFEVALKGLQGGVGPGNLDGKTQQDEDLDQNLVNEFLQLDLLSFDTVHKRKMITAAVCGTGYRSYIAGKQLETNGDNYQSDEEFVVDTEAMDMAIVESIKENIEDEKQWAHIKFECLKYGILNLDTIIAKLIEIFPERAMLQAFMAEISNDEDSHQDSKKHLKKCLKDELKNSLQNGRYSSLLHVILATGAFSTKIMSLSQQPDFSVVHIGTVIHEKRKE